MLTTPLTEVLPHETVSMHAPANLRQQWRRSV